MPASRTAAPRKGVIGVRLDETTLRAVDKICQDRGVTRSAFMRIAVVEYLGMRSDAQAVGQTMVRILELLEKLDSTIGASGVEMRSMARNMYIQGTLSEALLKSFLYRVPPPSEVEEAGFKARALADYAKLTQEIARKVADG
jgi:metal-responsive CopG/Arc/MetJ family transcriptional regulator